MNNIPLFFIKQLTSLSWSEAAWGYHNQYIGWSDVVGLACDRLAEGEAEPAVSELAGILKCESFKVEGILDTLTSVADGDEDWVRRKWLYLRLAWVYENRRSFSDPLGAVEEIYSDFDYPEDVAQFVRYMPVTDGYDPSTHTVEENDYRLLSKWKCYVDRNSKLFRMKP